MLGVTAALAHPHAVAREMVVTADHATAGQLRLAGRPIKFPGSPQRPSTAPPTLGQHTAEILRDELGYSEAEIAALRRDGVIDRYVPEVVRFSNPSLGYHRGAWEISPPSRTSRRP